MLIRIEQSGPDVLLWVKAVPGSSRDAVAGALGNRLKVRIAAPPEGGKANEAICRVIAEALGVKPRQVAVDAGQTSREKVIRIAATTVAAVQKRLDGIFA